MSPDLKIASRGSMHKLLLFVLLASAFLFSNNSNAERIKLADGFDFPVGKPDASGYYKARGLRLRSPTHFGEDWNGRAGGDSDLGDPVYCIGTGIVTFAHNVRQGWGNVVLIRHAYRDPASGKVKFVDSLYGHLDRIMVKVGQELKRGDQVGTIGSNFGMYPAHLHFEIRHNINIGMQRNAAPSDYANWADPTDFINKYRRLNREWRGVTVPTGTYQEYKGFKGL
ncbi:M23 family metallopeptidase [Luteolibacter sp. AS25]|uniref:M23 family metallopeptidase n=1 Tax=Luteolibacter sp. AS25 TaxID=3135776 RepID=UPI00398BB215